MQVKAQEREGILFCDICQIHSSASDMKAHLSSKKHQVSTMTHMFIHTGCFFNWYPP